MGFTFAICLQITLLPNRGSPCVNRTIWVNALCSYKAVSSLIKIMTGCLLGITVQLWMTLYLTGKKSVLCFSCYSHTGCRSMMILYGELPSPIPQPYRHLLSFDL